MVWADVSSVVYGMLCLLCGPACSLPCLPVCRFVWCVVGLFVVVGLWRGCGHVCGVVVSGLCVCLLMFDITIFITMNANLLGVWFFGILAFWDFGFWDFCFSGFWLFGILVFRDFGFSGFRYSGFWFSGFWPGATSLTHLAPLLRFRNSNFECLYLKNCSIYNKSN